MYKQKVKLHYSDIDYKEHRSLKKGLVFSSRIQANKILNSMKDIIYKYGFATLADLYDMANLPSRFIDTKLGWKSLSDGTIQRIREGYLLDLPYPINFF